ncbi:MAG: hypothetical protein IKP06_03405 [Elusimicrobiaceae bacterium]|nr:hypothetical protein [Elusimicrobiaceae bacterium]
MMHFIFKNKKGVTILEGLIALGILAMVSVGIFGVLLSISRKSTDTDVREEMVLAVSRATDALQLYSWIIGWGQASIFDGVVPGGYPHGVCSEYNIIDNAPMDASVWHDISCLLPPICDRDPNQSYFRYKPIRSYYAHDIDGPLHNAVEDDLFSLYVDVADVEFRIKCNGFTL